jgi:hypothetical protein
MTYEILSNLTPPASALTRNRTRGEFALTLDSLEVGQGFEYQSEGTLKSQYPRIAPKKFGNKRFKAWAVEGKDGTFAVIRQADRVVAEANPGVNTVANDDFDLEA